MGLKQYEIVDECIFDVNSEVKIEINKVEDLKKYYNNLNSGCGFSGFTPMFFGSKYIKE
jgi:hypothetical protein